MLVTLFVDASYYAETQSGAYAFYAISTNDRLRFAGRFRTTVRDSTHAELAAIANALHVVLAHRVAAGADGILIQSDNLAAIQWIEHRSCQPYPQVLAKILALAEKYGVKLTMRHIKAHSGTGHPRLYCHDWCDREARRIARLMHRERGGTHAKTTPRKRTTRKRKKKPPPLLDGDRVVGTYSPVP